MESFCVDTNSTNQSDDLESGVKRTTRTGRTGILDSYDGRSVTCPFSSLPSVLNFWIKSVLTLDRSGVTVEINTTSVDVILPQFHPLQTPGPHRFDVKSLTVFKQIVSTTDP